MDLIARNLNLIDTSLFKVDQGSLRDHLIKLLIECTRKISAEEAASTIAEKQTELHYLKKLNY